MRMLRHYNQLGLLTPSQIDSLTNYRYYSADQLPRLNRILAFRDLGFSLEQIGRMLNEDLPSEQLLGMLKLKRSEIELQVQMEQLRMSRLEARIRQLDNEPAAGSYDVILRDIEPVLTATLREVAADDERIHTMFNKLETQVAQYDQARADKPPFAIYYDGEYRESDIDAEVAVPLNYSIPDGDIVRVRTTPQKSNVACVVHAGNYSSLYLAYNALLGWIETNTYCMKGPIVEVYLRYGAEGLGFDLPLTHLEGDSDQYVTELQLSVEKR